MTNDHEEQRDLAASGVRRQAQGYSLVELVTVMAIFSIVMIITAKAFDRLISTGGHQAKSAASQIDGIVGLEMLRRDLTHAGYGLPWSYQVTPASAFNEVTGTPAASLGVTPSSFNEITPHALLAGTTSASSTNPGTDYLVIKSAMLALPATNSSVGRWGYLNYAVDGSGNPACTINRINDANSDVRNTGVDNVITLATGITASGAQTRTLLNTAVKFSYAVSDAGFLAELQPSDPTLSYIVYGIANHALAMPYNRADYYVNRPPAGDANFKVPLSCNSGTGTLFKAVADQAGGYFTPYPLLNCVADMKVIFFMDLNGDGSSSAVPATSPLVTALSPADLRSKLKSVTVYVLAQEGKKDPSYTYPQDSIFVGPVDGTVNSSSGKTWTKSQLDQQFPNWKQYRWKVYAIPVNPKNMQN